MADISLFVHVQGSVGLIELRVAPHLTAIDFLGLAEVSKAIACLDGEILLYIDEAPAPVPRHGPLHEHGAKHGGRVHLVRCREIAVRVYYSGREILQPFAPGTRLKRVKEWAAKEFSLAAGDAIEHVLQVNGTNERPNAATPLSQLVGGHDCSVVLDLVPDKRVEG